MADIKVGGLGLDDDCDGERGERGRRGHRGHDGATGPQGSTGQTGPTGPTGSPGIGSTIIAAARVATDAGLINIIGDGIDVGASTSPSNGVTNLVLTTPVDPLINLVVPIVTAVSPGNFIVNVDVIAGVIVTTMKNTANAVQDGQFYIIVVLADL